MAESIKSVLYQYMHVFVVEERPEMWWLAKCVRASGWTDLRTLREGSKLDRLVLNDVQGRGG
jgi:hypothetical protein